MLGANGQDLISCHSERSEESPSVFVAGDPSATPQDDSGSVILHLKEAEQEFVIENVSEAPIPSILRGFSAPVKLSHDLSDEQLAFLMVHDSDGFNRWDAAQQYYTGVVKAVVEGADVPDAFLDVYGDVLARALGADSDKALSARMMAVPDVVTLSQAFTPIDPVVINKARNKVLAAIKRTHRKVLDKLYKENASDAVYVFEAAECGRRALRNICLSLLTATNGTGCAKAAKAHYERADNMTDMMAALNAAADNKNAERDEIFEAFYERFKDYQLVIDKWFAAQAMAVRPDIIDHLNKLREHPDFNIKNPNRVRSLYAAFAMNNPVAFHAKDGSGYAFLTDGIIELNDINPQIAARLLTPLRGWRDYTEDRQVMMKAALEKILKIPDIAPDVFEIASKSLKG